MEINPFTVLGLDYGATDDETRAAYQALLRRYPPERDPHRFQLVQEAYQSARTARDRARWQVLRQPERGGRPFDALGWFAGLPGRARPPGPPALLNLLRACAAAARRDAGAASSPR